MATRFVVVDDVDTSIQYTGPWYLDQGSQDAVGNFGPPYQSTLHGVNANASLAFAFNGTQITVLGTSDFSNTSGVVDPALECFIDNSSIGKNRPLLITENNQVVCSHLKLTDGPHVLTVNATILTNQTFWLDDIQYAPSASVPLDQAVIMVDNVDPQLKYVTGWQALPNKTHMTTVPGRSVFTYDFIGVSVAWYGWTGPTVTLLSLASYSIDGQTPFNFILTNTPPNTSNLVFFQTAQLPAGPHTLEVVYEGSHSTPSLTLQHLVVQNGTLSSTTVTPGMSSTPTVAGNTVTPSESSTPTVAGGTVTLDKSSSTPTGAVAGGVIGGLALVILVLLGSLLLRRRQRHATQKKNSVSMAPTPYDYTLLHPLSATASDGIDEVSYPQSPQTTQMGTYEMTGQVYHTSMPSLTSTNVSRSIPPSASSGVAPYPANLNLANPSSSSPPASVSSIPSPLPNKTEKEAEALVSLRPQRRGNPSVPISVQNNDAWPPNVVLHADSGLPMSSTTARLSGVGPGTEPDPTQVLEPEVRIGPGSDLDRMEGKTGLLSRPHLFGRAAWWG